MGRKGDADMTWLLTAVWVLGGVLFVVSFWLFGVAAMRMIAGRRRARRIWHGHVIVPGRGPLRPAGFANTSTQATRRHRSRARSQLPVNGGNV